MKKLFLPVLGLSLLLAACGGGTPQIADATAPTVTLDASQSGTTVNLSAAANDNVKVTRVEFYRGSTLVSTDDSAPYTAIATVSAADNGNVTYTARAFDAAGNVGQGSKTIAVSVTPSTDITAPTVSLNASQSGTSVNLLATATDNVKVTRVEFYRGSTLISTDDSAPYAAIATVSAADNGDVTYTAKAYDAAGNVGQGSKTVAVSVTPAPPGTATLYQGVWSWAIGDLTSRAVIDSGVVIFSDEFANEGQTIAFGVYANQTEIAAQGTGKFGAALMGPVLQAGNLDVGFFLGTDEDARIFFTGQDSDNALGVFQGKAAFEGAGNIATASNESGQAVAIALVQVSDTVPTNAAAQNVMKAEGKLMAAGALRATFDAPARATAKANPALFRAMQQSLQLRR
ncbi:Ig-like domain-containing protein [Deinococcus marmoris]|uniref:Ig-like domain-containing protein n=1 Tax=Deinococcus marmoris TaxID=249408 RepID=UPI000AAC457F|nr:Ig-like domain-containing protein [Deinococcus marmoris]